MFKRLINIFSFRQLKPVHWLFIFAAFIIIHVPAIMHDKGNTNSYVLLAKSLLHGQTTLSTTDMPYVDGTKVLNTGDLILYQDKYYLPYPPAPALLIIPSLLIGGGKVNSILIAVLLSCLNIFILYSLFKKLEIQDKYLPWLIYGFFLGTSYWFVVLSSHYAYEFAEVVSVTGILLLLNELLGKKRALLMGLFLSIAFLSRQFTIIISLFVIGYFIYYYRILNDDHPRKIVWRKSALFLIAAFCGVLIYCLYNCARFDNPFDTGYSHIVFLGVLKERVDQYGVFSIHYVLYNLYNYLFRGFHIIMQGKGLMQIKDVNPFGTALFIASPFLLAAFKSGWNKFLRIFAWVTIGIIFTGLLFYHNNGKDQVNASRFTLDFLPLMMILVSLGAKNIPDWLFKGMVCYAIVLNIIAFAVHFIFHTYGQ